MGEGVRENTKEAVYGTEAGGVTEKRSEKKGKTGLIFKGDGRMKQMKKVDKVKNECREENGGERMWGWEKRGTRERKGQVLRS